MEALSIIVLVLVLVFYIWMIVLFVRMSRDTSAVRKHLDEQSIISTSTMVSIRDVTLSIILGNQEETYKRILTSLYNSYFKRCRSDGGYKIVAFYDDEKKLQSLIKVANDFCNILGYKLPEELSSMDAFLRFYNSQG